MEFDATQTDFAGTAIHDQDSGVVAIDGDDLGALRVEGAFVVGALLGFVPAPDRRDVLTHGRTVQAVAEFAVGRRRRAQADHGRGGAHAPRLA
jgi:hypothetical protein